MAKKLKKEVRIEHSMIPRKAIVWLPTGRGKHVVEVNVEGDWHGQDPIPAAVEEYARTARFGDRLDLRGLGREFVIKGALGLSVKVDAGASLYVGYSDLTVRVYGQGKRTYVHADYSSLVVEAPDVPLSADIGHSRVILQKPPTALSGTFHRCTVDGPLGRTAVTAAFRQCDFGNASFRGLVVREGLQLQDARLLSRTPGIYRTAAVGFTGHGQAGRTLRLIQWKRGGPITAHCGCFSGTLGALRAFIRREGGRLAASRTLALATALRLLEQDPAY